jgi:hypothetical protein
MGSKWISGRLAGRAWSRVTWLRIGTIGRLLCTWNCICMSLSNNQPC